MACLSKIARRACAFRVYLDLAPAQAGEKFRQLLRVADVPLMEYFIWPEMSDALQIQ